MADSNIRSDRGRDPPAWDDSRQAASDPLAELARLIGQSDAYPEADRRDDYRDDRQSGRSHEPAPAPSVDWAPEDRYAARDSRTDDHYAPPLAASPQPYVPEERGYEDDAPAGEGGRYFSGPAAAFSGFGGDADAYERDELSMALPARTPTGRAVASHHDSDPHHEYESDDPEYQGGEAYAADDYFDEAPAPRRRNGLLVIMAVLALTVIGTAGAFGYRAMFGGSVLPTLPPIIKAGNGPNKIVPAYGDSQANNSAQPGAVNSGSAENLVSREEQPVNIEPPKAAPRVVATIPIITGQGSLPPGVGAPAAPAQAADAAVQNSPGLPAPPPPAPAPAAAAAPVPAPAAPPAQAAGEPKKVHTVTIKSDQVGAPVPVGGPARAQTHPPHAAPSPAGSNAPLSIVPGSSGGAAAAAPPPQRARVAAAPVAVASAGSEAGVQASPSSGGGYAVQITSQRTAAEAHASFRELRAKFPNQLGHREAMIRRADLGAKGTFYRALVGPFSSSEQAAELCSGLKAAGGSCIVQRN
jgi:hypothetical protein